MLTVTTPALERLSQELTRRNEVRNVLLLDKVTSSAMTAMTLDVREDAGPRLKLRKVAPQKD